MSAHRINELIELLQPEWNKEGHLKMKRENHDAVIPGIAKDMEDDFKSAILRARGIQGN